mmetsp:Transcript_8020/g.11908  ORF Transcript_8020/g.11908 Transcript_8020/m.11908 type:complete len:691 (-) Transcript_8020:386-2458(-)
MNYSTFFDELKSNSQQSQTVSDEGFRLFQECHTIDDRKKRLTAYVSLRLGAGDEIEEAILEDMKSITCVVNCTGRSNAISQVSLDKENLTLKDTEFRFAWKYRHCNRRNHDDMSLVQDDGPLGFAYREVFHMEVEDSAGHTILIFFYGKWAQVMNTIMAMTTESVPNGRPHLSFLNIPAKCIFPHDGANTRQGDCPFCVCIGNSSRLRLCELGNRIRFDDFEDFEVHVAFDLSRYVKITSETIDGAKQGFSEVTISLQQKQPEKVPDSDSMCHDSTNKTSNKNGKESESPLHNDRVTVEKLVEAISSKRKSDEKFTYCSLQELGPIFEAQNRGANREKLNVYGIVIGFGMPYITNRGDWSMSVTLIDDTKSSKEAVALNMFLGRDSKLPALLKAGDVIRAHRVKVQEFNSRIQLLGFKESSYVVIRKSDPYSDCNWFSDDQMEMSEWQVESTAKKEYTFTLTDCFLSRCLWKFGQYFIINNSTILEEHKSTIASFDHGAEGSEVNFDMTALVTMVIPIPATERGPMAPRGYLRIWDGTGPPITDPLGDNVLHNSDMVFGDPSPEAIDSVAQVINIVNEDREEEDKLELPEALCGRVINLTVWEDSHWNFISDGRIGSNLSSTAAVRPGQWIRLRNVSVRSKRYFCSNSGSGECHGCKPRASFKWWNQGGIYWCFCGCTQYQHEHEFPNFF